MKWKFEVVFDTEEKMPTDMMTFEELIEIILLSNIDNVKLRKAKC